ncbi:MAG TPA: hypothetical protein VKA87_02150 [Nitrososphaeraceae archaeon]|jgi:hypothetical protein|nr:hypothetical protein [Nitrososphaeraceae archaeon]
MKTATTTITTTTKTTKRSRSLCLAKYIKTIQQANERTATQYEYRLSKFEKYIEELKLFTSPISLLIDLTFRLCLRQAAVLVIMPLAGLARQFSTV